MKRYSRPGPPPRYKRAPATPAVSSVAAAMRCTDVPVAIFVDLSNIWVGLRRAGERRGEECGLRFEFTELMRLLAATRRVLRAIAVADAELEMGVQRALRSAGFEVLLRERGRVSGSEQANDETL